MNISNPCTFSRVEVLGVGIQQYSSLLFQLRIRYILSAFFSLARIAFTLLIHNCLNSVGFPPFNGISATHIFPWATDGNPKTSCLGKYQLWIRKPPLNTGCSPGAASI